MKTRIASTIGALAVWVALTHPAQALMIAGWDFSQWYGDGTLSTDGVNPANTLSANYSYFDPTFNAGAESADFGTLYFDGQHGSSNVAVDFTGTEDIVPTAIDGGSLPVNLDAPVVGGGSNPFDSHAILDSEGQTFSNLLAMKANDLVSLVFEADMTSIPQFGTNWNLSFGGQTTSGTSTVGVEWSSTGLAGSYVSYGVYNLTDVATTFNINLALAAAEKAFVRLTMTPGAGTDARIDNVAINAQVQTGTVPALSSWGTAILALAVLCGGALLQPRWLTDAAGRH